MHGTLVIQAMSLPQVYGSVDKKVFTVVNIRPFRNTVFIKTVQKDHFSSKTRDFSPGPIKEKIILLHYRKK